MLQCFLSNVTEKRGTTEVTNRASEVRLRESEVVDPRDVNKE